MNEDYKYAMELIPEKDTLKASQSLVKMLAALEYSILESVSPTAARKIFRMFESIIH